MNTTVKKWFSRAGTLLFILFAVLVFYRYFVLEREAQTDAEVARIHATKLTLDDVMGKNLPPPPQNPDATIAGVDANKNGIRDDVELAIFATYPNSAKTRAVLLQYALALQNESTLQILNEQTATEAIREESRAFVCIQSAFNNTEEVLRNFVKSKQINNSDRKEARSYLYEKVTSFEALEKNCDIPTASLPD